jgi:hypothetical protein
MLMAVSKRMLKSTRAGEQFTNKMNSGNLKLWFWRNLEGIVIAAMLAVSAICLYSIYLTHQPCDDPCCGVVELSELEMSTLDDSEGVTETAAKRKQYKIWIAPGTVAGISEPDFRRRIVAGLNELSAFTNSDFVLVDSINGSHTRIYAANDQAMWQWFPKWKPSAEYPTGLVPLGALKGNQMRLTTRPRWGTPEQRWLEACVMHEMGHRLGIRYQKTATHKDAMHSPSNVDMMFWTLPVTRPSANDKQQFQKKMGKPMSMRFRNSFSLVA